MDEEMADLLTTVVPEDEFHEHEIESGNTVVHSESGDAERTQLCVVMQREHNLVCINIDRTVVQCISGVLVCSVPLFTDFTMPVLM
jgi:hypothetical protein